MISVTRATDMMTSRLDGGWCHRRQQARPPGENCQAGTTAGYVKRSRNVWTVFPFSNFMTATLGSSTGFPAGGMPGARALSASNSLAGGDCCMSGLLVSGFEPGNGWAGG